MCNNFRVPGIHLECAVFASVGEFSKALSSSGEYGAVQSEFRILVRGGGVQVQYGLKRVIEQVVDPEVLCI